MRLLGNPAIVLGCGPAGLFAAHALVRNGYDVTVFSKVRRSEMYGAQYLHAPIPGLTDSQEPVKVNYHLVGTAEEYRRKVYGDTPVSQASVEALERVHPAWDIRAAYYKAWDLYREHIQPRIITPLELQQMIRVNKRIPIVSSIPLPQLCTNSDHIFATQEIWAVGDAPERGTFAPFMTEANTVICNGTAELGWYRASNVFGYQTVEWPAGQKPPISGVSRVSKPLRNDCDCFARRVTRVGRYGRWEKGVLAHQAYETAVKL